MRMMLRFTAPVERSNQAIKDGSLKKTLESLMAKLKPEAAYFGPLEGKRAAMIFFDMAESSKIVEICEVLFSSLDAEVEFIPVMNVDDRAERSSPVFFYSADVTSRTYRGVRRASAFCRKVDIEQILAH